MLATKGFGVFGRGAARGVPRRTEEDKRLQKVPGVSWFDLR